MKQLPDIYSKRTLWGAMIALVAGSVIVYFWYR